VHSAMSAHNWVFLREEDDFEANLELLIDALDTDLEYVKEHTRLLTRAIEWDQSTRTRGLALSKQELQVAEGWLTEGITKEPKPTELHTEYVAFSRTAVDRFQRLMISSVTVAFVLVLGFAVFAFYQRGQAQETARIATSKSLAALALAEMEADPELSLLLATESIRITRRVDGVVLPLSNAVLRQMIIKSRVRLTLKGHGGPVSSAFYSPDGQRIVTASSDKTAKVWDANTGKELMTLRGHDDGINSAFYSADGARIVTASSDKTAKVWDANTGQELMTLKGHEDRVLSATYSPDGKRIVTGGQIARVWDANTGKELFTLKGHDGYVLSAFYSPDGARIVTGGGAGDNTAKVWDANTGKELMTLTGHEREVFSAAWSPNGKRIVTANRDNTAKLWDANTGKELMTLTGHESGVFSAAWSPNGKRIATATAGIAQIYTTDMDELLQIAESRVTRQLTAEEKETYGVLDLN